jgi:hypothetical protein
MGLLSLKSSMKSHRCWRGALWRLLQIERNWRRTRSRKRMKLGL